VANHDQINTPNEASRADRNRSLKDVIMYILGAGGLVLIIAMAIAASNYCMTIPEGKPPWDDETVTAAVWWFIKNFFTAGFVLIVLAIVTAVLDFLVPKTISRLVTKLEATIDRLSKRSEDGDEPDGIVPRMEAVNSNFENCIVPAFTTNPTQLTSSGNGIIETLREIIQKLELIDDQVILYEGDPGRTMADFIVHKEMIVADLRIVRLAGTMLGASGGETYSISYHIVNLTNKKLENNKPDIFKECRVVLPGGNGIAANEERYRLYPACGRFFALDTLMKISEMYTHHDKVLPPGGISIKLRFKYSDIFPAWHIWGDEKFLLLCSIGIDDKYRKDEKEKAIANALPIALGASKVFSRKTANGNIEFQLSRTIDRLQNYFDNDLFEKDNTDQIETWELLPSDSSEIIKLKNLQASVWGENAENKIKGEVSFWGSLYKGSSEISGRVLSKDEIKELRDIFKKIGEIDNEETKDSN